jgi:16S rRNA (cytosine1402-N4)-methyltransferase
MSDYLAHYSVMMEECLKALELGSVASGSLQFADLTFGAGGHTFAISDRFPGSTIYATDQDPDALNNGLNSIQKKTKEQQIHLLAMNFKEFPAWCDRNNMHGKLAGILMDLGVSSHQFDKMERGFSFRADAPLDMRMNYRDPSIPTAADLLNSLSEKEIADIIFNYGEERLSRKIASRIVELRQNEKIATTRQIEDICFHAYPVKDRHGKIHPATRTFQALRIAVNEELGVLEKTLEKLMPFLADGGVLAVISFHSLEDRIVKHTFKKISENGPVFGNIITKKPITASQEELAQNSRSRSAKLRIIQKTVTRESGTKKNKYRQASDQE